MNDGYWIRTKDPQMLVDAALERIKNYYDAMRSAPYTHKVVRSWCYYHGLYLKGGTDLSWEAVTQLDRGNILFAWVNHIRALVDDQVGIVTNNQLSFGGRAYTDDHASQEQAATGRQIAEHYVQEEGLANHLRRAVRDALVLAQGYLHIPWDPYIGEEYEQELFEEARDQFDAPVLGEDGEPLLVPKTRADGTIATETLFKGEYDIQNPVWFDFAGDLGVRRFKDRRWTAVRSYANRWEVAARCERRAWKKLVESGEGRTTMDLEAVLLFRRLSLLNDSWNEGEYSDVIPIWTLYHKRTVAHPEGTVIQFTEDGVPITKPAPLPYDDFPIFRCVPTEIVGSELGYSRIFDIQPLAELMNAEISSTATNHKGGAYCGVWIPNGSDLEESTLSRGFFTVRGGDHPPVPISFEADSPGRQRYYDTLKTAAEEISGVNAVHRGNPGANFRSGKALQLMDAKAVQSAGELAASYYKMAEDAMTYMVLTLREKMADDEERYIAVAGDKRRARRMSFTKDDIAGFDRIYMNATDTILSTMAGRLHVAEFLASNGLLTTPKDIIAGIESGSFDGVTEPEDGQIRLVEEENEALRMGQPVMVDATDDHVYHMRKHAAQRASQSARNDPEFMKRHLAHEMGHIQALMHPNVSLIQAALGYKNPLAAVALAGLGQPSNGKSPGPNPSGSNVPADDLDATSAREPSPAVQSQPQGRM